MTFLTLTVFQEINQTYVVRKQLCQWMVVEEIGSRTPHQHKFLDTPYGLFNNRAHNLKAFRMIIFYL